MLPLLNHFLKIRNTSKSPIREKVIFLNIKILLQTLKREVIHTISITQNKRMFCNYLIEFELYTAYYAVSENEEIVAGREIEIPGIEENTAVEKGAEVVVEPNTNVEVMNPNNNQNEISRKKEQADSARKQQIDFDSMGKPEIHNSSDVKVTRVGGSMTDVTDKAEYLETKENETCGQSRLDCQENIRAWWL